MLHSDYLAARENRRAHLVRSAVSSLVAGAVAVQHGVLGGRRSASRTQCVAARRSSSRTSTPVNSKRRVPPSIAFSLAAYSRSDERDAFEFEAERMRRIQLDFSLSEQQARDKVREQIPDLRPEEFAAWDAAGLLEHRVIDGSKRYFNRAPSNLFRLSEQARARRAQQTPLQRRAARKAPIRITGRFAMRCSRASKTSVAPRRVRVTQSITVEPDAVPAGETVRAWLPFPRALPGQQEDIRFVASEPAQHTIAPESTLQRTVYFERAAHAGKPTTFSITYELTIFGQYHPIDPAKVTRAEPTRELAPYLGERPPHIVFTDDLRKFSREVVGDERNPYRIAQKLFARRRSHSLGRRARILDAPKHQRLRAARRPCRLRPADAAADDAAAAQRHSGALAVRHGFLGRRLRQPARLGLAVSRALRLGADGRDVRPARRRRSAARHVLSRRARCLSHRLQRRLQPAVRAAEAALPFRDRRPAARRSRMARRQSVFRPVGLHVQGARQLARHPLRTRYWR